MSIYLQHGEIIYVYHAGMNELFITPQWPAPTQVKALTTTRYGGFSEAPFNSMNLGDHAGDRPSTVAANRQQLSSQAQLPSQPLWLRQTHSTLVIESCAWHKKIQADGLITSQRELVCAVLTADCLPVLLCDQQGRQVAAIHAGWRGLLNGILETAVKAFACPPEQLFVWLGPAIGPTEFEVGQEVYDAFVSVQQQAAQAFQQHRPGHYLADIYQLARQRLAMLKVHAVYGGEYCTVSQADTFFSYRRDQQTGRMASLIWIAAE